MTRDTRTMKTFTADFLNRMIAEAGSLPRRRTHHNLHESADDPVQRYFVAARQDSYFRPHRHAARREFAVVVQGRFDILLFDDAGRVTRRVPLGPGADAFGFELPPGIWHSWVVMTDAAVFAEVKAGPYDPQTASEFAPWSPAEGSPEAARLLERMRRAGSGERLL